MLSLFVLLFMMLLLKLERGELRHFSFQWKHTHIRLSFTLREGHKTSEYSHAWVCQFADLVFSRHWYRY